MTLTITGLDLSLSSTGICRIQLDPGVLGPDNITITTRRIQSTPPKPTDPKLGPTLQQRSQRLRKLAGQIVAHAPGSDLVCVEGPSYNSKSGHAHDRSGLWALVVHRLIGAGLNVVEIPPALIKRYATGNGGAGKDVVLAATVLRYQHLATVTGNDEADALIAAAMGARWIGQPVEESLPETHRRATRSVRWAS